jgi:integrase
MSIGSSDIYSFHNKRHPLEMAESEIAQFLSSLATEGRVSASTQNQALNALLFLYSEVLNKKIGLIEGVVRAKRPQRLPVVLTKEEVKKVIDRMDGLPRLMVILLYGGGLRLMECCRLRVKDIDLSRNEIVVRAGKGDKDRHAANSDQGVSFQTYRSGSMPTSQRYRERTRSRCVAERSRSQIPERGSRMGMAVGFSSSPPLH